MKNYKVYIHTFPNGKKYVGITCLKSTSRWKNGSGYINQPLVYKAILKYGWNNIKHEILFENLTGEEAEQKEIELIGLYKSNNKKFGYNVSNGGMHTGQHNEEAKKKMSIANKGKIISEETREKLRQANLGKKPSDKTREKLRTASQNYWIIKNGYAKGTKYKNPNIFKTKKRIIKEVAQFDTNGILLNIYKNITEASKSTGITKTGIYYCCQGKRGKSGSYIWKYN